MPLGGRKASAKVAFGSGGKTALGDDRVKPTDYQIRSGHIVVPKGFYNRERSSLDWDRSFALVAFGERFESKRIDYDRRLNFRLRGKISSGEVLQLSINDGVLVIDKA